MARRRFQRSAAPLLAALLVLAPATAAAQEDGVPAGTADPVPRWVDGFAVLGANVLAGGLTAGIAQKLRGGSFRDGFTRGALGGGVVYVGKRLAAERFDGAGFLGREVAAVGSSLVRNAADGRPSLDRIALPLGPLRLYAGSGTDRGLQARIDLGTLASSGYAILRPELKFDAAASLSAGAPVFRAERRGIRYDDRRVTGLHMSGVILLGDRDVQDPAATFAHERVHVLQGDFELHTWSDPLNGWLFDRIPHGRTVGRYIDLNTLGLALGAVILVFGTPGSDNSPWEVEAEILTRP